MKTLSKTLLASALFTAGVTGFTTAQAVEWGLSGELAVEWTDSDAEEDLGIAVTTTDLVLTISEKFGDVEVEGYIAYEKDGGETVVAPVLDPATGTPTGDVVVVDSGDSGGGLANDGAGITVSGAFGSVFVGDDGTGVFVGDATDVLYNNSEAFFVDPTTNVIDYGLPLSGGLSLNLFLDSSSGDDEDIDAIGAYGSYSAAGLTFALGFTSIEEDGAYGSDGSGIFEDDILDVFVGYETGPIALGAAFQGTEAAGTDHEVTSFFLTYTAGAVAITPYFEDLDFGAADNDVVALNISYSFTDNFYAFFETADFDSDDSDNTEVGLVLTF